MHKMKIHCTWGFDFEFYNEKQIEVFIDQPEKKQEIPGSMKILLNMESHAIIPQVADQIIKNQSEFDFILTFNEDVLSACKNAHLFEYGTSWIHDPYLFPLKRFEVSTLVGGKKSAPGHQLRNEVWNAQEQITVPKNFFISGNSPGNTKEFSDSKTLGKDKDPLFESQFHIAIENVKRKYYFTEKVMDCLYTKTVPIYYGATEIGNYFNLNGMYIVDNLKDIIEVCNGLNKDEYNNKKIFIEENFEKCKKFINIVERIKEKINELVK